MTKLCFTDDRPTCKTEKFWLNTMAHFFNQLGAGMQCINVKLEAPLIADFKNIKTGDGKNFISLLQIYCEKPVTSAAILSALSCVLSRV